MKKSIFTGLILIMILCVCFGQEIFEQFDKKHVSADVKNHTLLILKYRPLVENEPGLKQDTIKHKTLLKFIKRENTLIEKYNFQLKKAFDYYYSYPFLIIDEEELANYPSSEYPYAYKRYPHVKEDKKIAYSRFFIDRKNKFIYDDINLYSNNSRERVGVEKDIVYALSEFLLYDSIQHVTQEELIKE